MRKALVLLVALIMMSCAHSERSSLYNESTAMQRATTAARRVAIVPNRLPLNLNDPEKWRVFNWRIAAEEFRTNGFEVVDYEAARSAFERSGLPVEDTQASRDKYAALADELGVDLIVVPYYGTMMNSGSAILWTRNSWNTTATYQIYRRDVNDFATRIDCEGIDTYVGGLASMAGLVAGLAVPDEPMIGAGLSVLGLLADLTNMVFRGPDSHWRGDFERGIRSGLRPYLSTLRAGSRPYAPSAPAVRPAPTPNIGVVCPSCGAQNNQGSRFCTKCGASLSPTPATPQVAPQQDVDTIVCPACGHRNPAGRNFCTSCGKPLK